MAIHRGVEIPYWLGVLIGFDQFINCLFPKAVIDETISSRLGRAKAEGRLTWHRKPVARWIYEELERRWPGHCERSIGA
jgi:hypothetical protein